jgi:hypothetical protein
MQMSDDSSLSVKFVLITITVLIITILVLLTIVPNTNFVKNIFET